MPEIQQHRAAASSARARVTRRLTRDLRSARPLTETQRAAVIAAAASIPTITADKAAGGAA